jgi:hypothetical protein
MILSKHTPGPCYYFNDDYNWSFFELCNIKYIK